MPVATRSTHWLHIISLLILTAVYSPVARCQLGYARAMSRQFDSLYAYRLSWPAIQSNAVTVHYKNIDTTYVNAILTILTSAVKVYEDSLPIVFPRNIVACVGREEGKRDSKFQNSYDRIIWEYGSDSALVAPTHGGHHNVYGLCHELGHMTLGFADYELSEAWADHIASFVALPIIYAQMGDNAWPDNYNFLKIEGAERSIGFSKRLETRLDFAIKIFYDLQVKYGLGLLKRLVSEFQPQFRDKGTITLDALKNKLIEVTQDSTLAPLFYRYRYFQRGKLYTPAERENAVPAEIASRDSNKFAYRSPGHPRPAITGKCIVFFFPTPAEFDSLCKDKDSGFENLLKDQYFAQRDIAELLKSNDISVTVSYDSLIRIAMLRGPYLLYNQQKFKHPTGFILTDGVRSPLVISGAANAEDIVASLKEFFRLK